MPSFSQKRQEAQELAKAKSISGTPNISEIYLELESPYNTLMDAEMQLDKTTLQVNPEILEVLDFAKAQNKTVILVADSYYSSKFIIEIL